MINDNIKKFFYLLLIALPIVYVTGCDFGEIKSKATVGEMDIAVDENLEPWMKAEKTEFVRLNKDAILNLRYTPTTIAIAELINAQTKTIIVSRNFNQEEHKVIAQYKIPVDSHIVAIDGVAFIVNPKNPVLRLTSEDLKKVFTGEFKKWTDIKSQDEAQNKDASSVMKGKDQNIKVFIQRKNSFTHDYIKEEVLKNAEYTSAAIVCSTSVQMLNEIRNNVNAIGISNSGWLATGNQEELDSTVKTIRVSLINAAGRQEDYVEFHQGFIANGNYPYRRVVYLLTTEKGIGLLTGFLGFLSGKDGQKIALKQGLVPVTQPVRTIQIN